MRSSTTVRILAQKESNRVRLITRNNYDFAERYPLIVDAIANLPVSTCIIDGEAIVVDQNGYPSSTCFAIANTITPRPYVPSMLSSSRARIFAVGR